MPTVEEMVGRSDELTKTQAKIFEYMLRHQEAVCYAPLRELAARIGVTEVSVLKVCRKLGCSGYAEMKEVFRQHVAARIVPSAEQSYTLETIELGSGLDRPQLLQAILDAEGQNLASQNAALPKKQLFLCAQALLKAREVLIFGHDASKILADYLAHRLLYLRIKAASLKLGDNDTVQTSLAMANGEDLIVLFSFPPYYSPVANVVRYAAYLGATVITITDSTDSPAVAGSHYTLLCPTKTKFFFNSLTGPISLIHVLTSCIALELGQDLDRILEEEVNVSRLLSGEFPEEGGAIS